MPMRRTISISLACLVTSCALAETPEKNASQYPGEATGVTPGNPEMPTGKASSFSSGAAQERGSPDDGSDWTTPRCAGFEPVADACRSRSHPCCGLLRAAGGSQFGKAAWYDLVGYRTASGEILDTVTATAAHRSLPLASYAKVTNLNNGRSVVVKINDRGVNAIGVGNRREANIHRVGRRVGRAENPLVIGVVFGKQQARIPSPCSRKPPNSACDASIVTMFSPGFCRRVSADPATTFRYCGTTALAARAA